MKIFVEVKTNAKTEEVVRLDEDKYKVLVKPQPEKGKANKDVIKVLANYFKIPQNDLWIRAGHTSKSKIIEIKKRI